MTEPQVFASAHAFSTWLEEHQDADEIWVALPKKGTQAPSVTRSEALDAALCFSWIDGKAAAAASMPEGWWAQRFTPRRPRSMWSKINCERVEELIRTGRMRPAGLEQVERAKADGRWAAAYDPPGTAEVPDDLRRALAQSPAAQAAFDKLGASRRYLVLHDIEKAVKPETRARRIDRHVTRLATGEPPR